MKILLLLAVFLVGNLSYSELVSDGIARNTHATYVSTKELIELVKEQNKLLEKQTELLNLVVYCLGNPKTYCKQAKKQYKKYKTYFDDGEDDD